ncbi:MAG TPA: N-acetylmuramoyl-L-alanine amidase [Spirochaetota bacterium]|nr:N-acetylmuramoyl-L-alanine amidase [Spirochaetota bacterium]
MRIILISIFLICTAVSIHPAENSDLQFRIQKLNGKEYVSLYEICRDGEFDQSIDPVLGRGKIYKKTYVAVYQIDLSVMLAGKELIKADYPVRRGDDGEVFIPADSAQQILTIMLEKKFLRQGNYLKEDKESKTVIKKPVDDDIHYEEIDFIVIDAGHGGKDPGAVGKGGKREKDITLAVSKRIRDILKRELKGVNISLTRSTDVFLELGERTEIANKLLRKSKNGLFISIHVNASISPKSSGFETYYLSRDPTTDDARVTATLENNVVILETKKKHHYDDIEFIEALMLAAQIQKESHILAELIQKNMTSAMKQSYSRGVKRADFFVLRGSLMPAVLVEIGYITNKKELNLLITPNYQAVVSGAVAGGITSFVAGYNKLVK